MHFNVNKVFNTEFYGRFDSLWNTVWSTKFPKDKRSQVLYGVKFCLPKQWLHCGILLWGREGWMCQSFKVLRRRKFQV